MAKANAELRAENEALRAQLDSRSDEPVVRELWIPQPNHPAGDQVGVSLHTLDGERWAIRHEFFLGMRAWSPEGWTPPISQIGRDRVYIWSKADAVAEGRKVAEMLARQEAEAQATAVKSSAEGEFAREMADEVEQLVDTVREAVAVDG